MKWKGFILLAVVFFFSTEVFSQCSQCSLLAEQSGNGEMGSGNNINTGILYIMAIVYLILMTAFVVIYYDQIKTFLKKKFKKGERA